jgi:hypothetical protein
MSERWQEFLLAAVVLLCAFLWKWKRERRRARETRRAQQRAGYRIDGSAGTP